MCISDEELVDEVFILHRSRCLTTSTTALRLIRGDWLRLCVSAMRERDDHVLWLDQIFDRQVGVILDDLGAALVSVLCADIFQLCPNYGEQPLRARQDVTQVL